MIAQLKKIWQEQAFTNQIVEDYTSMLDYSGEMLKYAQKVIVNIGKGKKSEKKIYTKDQKINFTEQDIRKRILVHLSANPGANLPACLALIKISKDAERLGDYIKNTFELHDLISEKDMQDPLYEELFVEIGNEVRTLMDMVNKAFNDSDVDIARASSAKGRELSRRCEEVIQKLLGTDYPTRKAVTVTLGSRYFKRIALHLANIATSIYMPLPEMDYIDK